MNDCNDHDEDICTPILSERRRPLSEEQVDRIRDQLLESIYADIGKSVVKKFLWIFGAICLAVLAWLNGSGHFQVK